MPGKERKHAPKLARKRGRLLIPGGHIEGEPIRRTVEGVLRLEDFQRGDDPLLEAALGKDQSGPVSPQAGGPSSTR